MPNERFMRHHYGPSGYVPPQSKKENVMDQNIMRHAYRELTEQDKKEMTEIKDTGLAFWNLCEQIGLHGAPDKAPGSRELSLAKTKIEEAVMWATKHITK